MTEERPPRRRFHDELEALQDKLLDMAGLVEQVIGQATHAALARDGSADEKVSAADYRIDQLEMEIDEQVLELLALQQPMAGDLRQIVTANQIANDLERMADHAVNIAKAAKRLAAAPPLPEIRELAEMTEIVREMVADALVALVSRSAGKARLVCLADDRVDDLRHSMFRILVTHMLEDPKRITAAIELLLVTQNLERIGDLATNIAEDVVFLVEGKTIRHGAEVEHPRQRGHDLRP
jgi:phosphate transport system protein